MQRGVAEDDAQRCGNRKVGHWVSGEYVMSLFKSLLQRNVRFRGFVCAGGVDT